MNQQATIGDHRQSRLDRAGSFDGASADSNRGPSKARASSKQPETQSVSSVTGKAERLR